MLMLDECGGTAELHEVEAAVQALEYEQLVVDSR
jgi:hypothetical protein